MPSNELPAILNERSRGNLIDFVDGVVRNTLRQSLDYTTDFPGFLADPAESTGPFAVAKAVGQQSCRRWARGEGIPSLPGFDALYGGICKPYLQSLNEMPEDGVIGPPFDGGQCNAVYVITITASPGDGSPDITFNRRARGPIGGGRITQTGSTFTAEVFCRGLNSSSPNCGSQADTGAGWYFTGIGGASLENGSCSVSIAQACGLDNCGDPPPEYDPPNIPPGLPPLTPITINVPGIGDVAVDVGFGENGEILVSLPDLGIDLEFPNPLFDGGGGEEAGNPPGYQGNPADSQDVGPGEAAEGEDEDRPLLGVLVQTIETPPRANMIFNQTENYTKGAYFVYLGGDAGLTLIDTAAITRPSQFFYAPEGSNRYRVVPNNGFTIRVTPYYDGE